MSSLARIDNGAVTLLLLMATLCTSVSAVSRPIKPIKLCPPNEEYTTCGGCEPSCMTSKADALSMQCATVCREGCQCIPGYKRNSAGNCVEKCEEDMECPPNQQYVTCGGCEPTCAMPKPEACLAVCVVGCQCLPGFLRDSDGNCVSTCPDQPGCTTPIPCGENEELKDSASTCEPTCADRNPICNKMAALNVCRCIDGYIRESDGGRCIPIEKCPSGCRVETCKTKKCPPGTKCVQETIFCVRAPCPQPPPQCVPVDPSETSTGTPPTSCEEIKCKPNETCSVLFPLCLPDGPCPPPVARCYPRCKSMSYVEIMVFRIHFLRDSLSRMRRRRRL